MPLRRVSRAWITRLRLAAAVFALVPAQAGAAQLTASWVDNSAGVAMTRVERRHGSETTYTPVADTDPGTATYVDAAVSAGATYCYRVFAWLDESVSPYSEEACATSAVDTVTVTVAKNGTGNGTVTSTPAGIECGTSCSMTVTSGAFVTLTATAASGSVFSGWSGGPCAGTEPCGFATNTSAAVTATFSPAPVATPPSPPPTTYALVVTKSGPGIVTAPGISCGSDCSDTYSANTTVTLTATPNHNGTAFAGWGGACAGTSPTCTLTMDGAKAVSVTFKNGKGK